MRPSPSMREGDEEQAEDRDRDEAADQLRRVLDEKAVWEGLPRKGTVRAFMRAGVSGHGAHGRLHAPRLSRR